MTTASYVISSHEVIIIGAGPIGIELAIALQRAGVDYLLIEARQIGDAVSRWPAETHFYSTPEHVALAGVPVHTGDQLPISGEQYLAYLRMLVEMFDLQMHNYEPVTSVRRDTDRFIVHTAHRAGPRQYAARYVVAATGGMTRPRLLNIPGEELPHVTHYFPGPHRYFRTRVLVVGGRNSALETALRCWRAGAQVTLSYRRPAFDFDVVKPHLAMDISDRLRKDEITFYPATVPEEITPTEVTLAPVAGREEPGAGVGIRLATDFVVICTGFEADMGLLQTAGVMLQGPERAPVYNPETMESNISGLFVAGTAAGGTQRRFVHFISTSHDHVARIVGALTGRVPDRLGTVSARNNAVTYQEVKAN